MKKRLKKKLALRTNYHYAETTSKVKKDKMLVNDSDKEELKPIQPKKPEMSIKETEKKLKLTHKKDPEPKVKIKEESKAEKERKAYESLSTEDKIEYLNEKLRRSGSHYNIEYDYDIFKRKKKPTSKELEAYVKILEDRYENRKEFFKMKRNIRIDNAIKILHSFGLDGLADSVEELSEVMNFGEFDSMLREIENSGKINLWDSDQEMKFFSMDTLSEFRSIITKYKRKYGV